MEINPQIQSYLNDNFNLVKSIVVKSDLVAQAVNNRVYALTGVMPDPSNPASWKYYQNLAGNYTPYDPPIFIYSLDTGEQMEFTPANLAISPVTLSNYYPGSFFFDQLVTAYPDQQDLILSIIYPVDIDVAINALDGTILNYNSGLVEENEYTLMSDLNTWSQNFHVRWDVKAFAISDEYYPAAQKAVYYTALVPKLLSLRTLRCHTIEVHSFHVTQFLASHNELSQYIGFLTLSQRLYLYRNINHYRRHSGFKKIFTDLIDLLAVPNNILIGALNLEKTNTLDNDLPVSEFFLDNLSGVQTGNISDVFTLSATLDLEMPLNNDSSYYVERNLNRITDLTQSTVSNKYLTKIIYSNNLKIGNPYAFTFQQTIFNELLYIAYYNQSDYSEVPTPKYNAIALVQLLNGRYIYLSPIDAVYLMMYLGAAVNGVTLNYLPTLTAASVLRTPPPPFSAFEQYTDYNDYQWAQLETIYNEALSLLPSNQTLDNIVMFYDYCQAVYDARVQFYLYTASIQGVRDRAFIEAAFRSFFADFSMPPLDNTVLYDIWLNDRYIDLTTYSVADLTSLFIQVYLTITNYDLSLTDSYLETIESVIAIIKSLCSYTLQFVTDFTSEITSVDIKDIRVSHMVATFNGFRNVNVFNLTGIEVPRPFYRLETLFSYSVLDQGNSYVTLQTANNNLNLLTPEQISQLANFR